jgi:hypothetical protein
MRSLSILVLATLSAWVLPIALNHSTTRADNTQNITITIGGTVEQNCYTLKQGLRAMNIAHPSEVGIFSTIGHGYIACLDSNDKTIFAANCTCNNGRIVIPPDESIPIGTAKLKCVAAQ